MKKLPILFAITVLASGTPMLPEAAVQASPEAVEHCQTNVLPNIPEANLGECISSGKTEGGPGFAAHLCDIYLELYPDIFYFNWDNMGECVNDLRDEV